MDRKKLILRSSLRAKEISSFIKIRIVNNLTKPNEKRHKTEIEKKKIMISGSFKSFNAYFRSYI